MLTLINSVLEVQNAGIVAPKLAPVDTVYDTTFVHTDVDLAALARGMNTHGSARLCLYGPPGTGKTAYAQWLAKYLKKPLIQKKSSDILSMWVGRTEANIAKAFEQAKRENAILLIDEADSFYKIALRALAAGKPRKSMRCLRKWKALRESSLRQRI